MSNILEQLKSLIFEKTAMPVEALDASKPLNDYGIDSLAFVEIVFSIEDAFNVNLENFTQEQLCDLNSIARVIEDLSSTHQVCAHA